MLRWRRKRPWLASAAIAALLVAILFFGSFFVQLFGELCAYNEQNKTTDCAQYHLGPFALFWIIEVIAPARILEWQSLIYYQPEVAAFTPVLGAAQGIKGGGSLTLPPGLSCPIEHRQPPVDTEHDRFASGDGRWFILGKVVYAGADGIERITGFCREYSRDTGRWHAVKDSEYEYCY